MADLSAPPVLSTPAELLFEDPTPHIDVPSIERTDDGLRDTYEIDRTAREVTAGGWRRIALQFPDHMLPDGPRVSEILKTAIAELRPPDEEKKLSQTETRLYILADTSYSACCVDEIAAEHIGADVVVHYGRACLSPTARLPVIHVFTRGALELSAAISAFEAEVADKEAKVVVMADVTFQQYVWPLCDEVRSRGYVNILATEVVHNPRGKLPNRRIVKRPDGEDESNDTNLKDYAVFHIATPPTALLLALSSRVASLYIMAVPSPGAPLDPPPTPQMTRAILGRRYARILTLASAGIIGILVNTLSVANYLDTVDRMRKRIAAAGKKSYTVVVGKLNPAKLANFAEIDGWVVVGCWESGLVEGDGFYRPVITPFELDVALTDVDKRIWGGDWWAGIEGTEEWEEHKAIEPSNGAAKAIDDEPIKEVEGGGVDDEESEPPEFDLRTGKLISRSRPMRNAVPASSPDAANDGVPKAHDALVIRATGEMATIKGIASPGAEFLRSQRTWTGLGSDYTEEQSTLIEEGRSGIARGYTVGEVAERR